MSSVAHLGPSCSRYLKFMLMTYGRNRRKGPSSAGVRRRRGGDALRNGRKTRRPVEIAKPAGRVASATAGANVRIALALIRGAFGSKWLAIAVYLRARALRHLVTVLGVEGYPPPNHLSQAGVSRVR